MRIYAVIRKYKENEGADGGAAAGELVPSELYHPGMYENLESSSTASDNPPPPLGDWRGRGEGMGRRERDGEREKGRVRGSEGGRETGKGRVRQDRV